MDERTWLRESMPEPAEPDVDVTADVMRTLRERRPPAPSNTMFLTIALASSALAAVSIVIAQQMVSSWQDPLAALLRF